MSRVKETVDRFNHGMNCAQSIIGTYGPDYNLSEDECLRIASGFGGGMRRAEVCGAVSGSIMVLGLDYNPADITDSSKEMINARVVDFTNKFEQKCGSILCRDLLGCDISTPEGQQEAKEKNTSTSICPGLVQSAAQILEEISP